VAVGAGELAHRVADLPTGQRARRLPRSQRPYTDEQGCPSDGANRRGSTADESAARQSAPGV